MELDVPSSGPNAQEGRDVHDRFSGVTPAVKGVRAATVGDLMRLSTTVEPRAHLVAAAYLIKRSHNSALVVTRGDLGRAPLGRITDANVSQAVADGKTSNK